MENSINNHSWLNLFQRYQRRTNNALKVITYDDLDKIIGELFVWLFLDTKLVKEIQVKYSDLIFDCVNLIYYKCHKIKFKLGGSYIDSPDWINQSNNKPKKW